jgi:hypothetical protein
MLGKTVAPHCAEYSAVIATIGSDRAASMMRMRDKPPRSISAINSPLRVKGRV